MFSTYNCIVVIIIMGIYIDIKSFIIDTIPCSCFVYVIKEYCTRLFTMIKLHTIESKTDG